MKLADIFENGATTTIQSYERELIRLLSSWNSQLEDAIEEDEPWTAITPQRTQKADWIHRNLHLLQAVVTRSKDFKHAAPIKDITYSANKETELTKGGAFKQVLAILASHNPTLQSLVAKHNSLTTQALSLAKGIKQGTYDYRDRGKVEAKPTKDLNRGKQSAQVEEIINSVLATLPKDKATTIRQQLARSDNKLQLLQSLVGESVVSLETMLLEHIVHRGSDWAILNKDKTKELGSYPTKKQAVKRLRQIEYFKHHS